MPNTPEHVLLWGLTWANIIAFVGILVNLLWNFRNSLRDRKTRRNTLKLAVLWRKRHQIIIDAGSCTVT